MIKSNTCEFVIEKVITQSEGNKVFITLGKLIVPNTLHLSNEQLDCAWHLMNYGPVNIEPVLIIDGLYADYVEISADGMVYIPTYEKEINYVNDDIFIRPKNNLQNGYYIWNNHHKSEDEWRYSANREEVIGYLLNNIY